MGGREVNWANQIALLHCEKDASALVIIDEDGLQFNDVVMEFRVTFQQPGYRPSYVFTHMERQEVLWRERASNIKQEACCTPPLLD